MQGYLAHKGFTPQAISIQSGKAVKFVIFCQRAIALAGPRLTDKPALRAQKIKANPCGLAFVPPFRLPVHADKPRQRHLNSLPPAQAAHAIEQPTASPDNKAPRQRR